jgi:hypothetical protein
MFESALLGSSTNINYQPDIIGKRNGGSFYFTFNTPDSAHHIQVTNAGIITHVQKVNLVSPLSGLQGSKPGIRNLNNDSCFTLYSESNQHSVWAAVGCSGEIIGINSNNNSFPMEYSLSQNYPNPFNPSTKINYALPFSGIVRLTIYDVLGNELAVPVNEYKQAGRYEININASNLASGVYFYKIDIESGGKAEYTETKKMLLIK